MVHWLIVLTALGSAPSAAQLILANGDFEAGSANWALSQQKTARADFSVVEAGSPAGGKGARIAIATPSLPQHLQLMCGFPTDALTPGEAYELERRNV